MGDGIIPFVAAFSKIHNIDFHAVRDSDLTLRVSEEDVLSMRDVTLRMTHVLEGGAAALGSGAYLNRDCAAADVASVVRIKDVCSLLGLVQT